RTFHFEGDPSDIFGSSGGGDASSFFDMFFNQDTTGEGNTNSRTRRQASHKGQDIEAEMPVTLLEAYQGSQRTFELNGKKMRVTIKPGVYDGQRLKIKNKGYPGFNGGLAGDLYIILRVQPDFRFHRNVDHLIYTADVDLYTTLLGGKIEVPTMTGAALLTVPKESETGKTLRLKGKGMPNYKNPAKFGDLMIKLNVQLPKNLSEEEETLLKKLKAIRVFEKEEVS
ncbi:MAG: curved DNA-binding protein, partial [Saprospiraceae bacterium]